MSRRTSGGTGLLGDESEPLLLPEELFLTVGEDGKLFGVGRGVGCDFASALSSSSGREEPRFPELLRLVLL